MSMVRAFVVEEVPRACASPGTVYFDSGRKEVRAHDKQMDAWYAKHYR